MILYVFLMLIFSVVLSEGKILTILFDVVISFAGRVNVVVSCNNLLTVYRAND